MNTPNNKRKKESQQKIQQAFLQLLQEIELDKISVTAICKLAKINRSTFYANYLDIYDLVDKIKNDLDENYLKLYREEEPQNNIDQTFFELLKHIQENQVVYQTYFRLGLERSIELAPYSEEDIKTFYGDTLIPYHAEFFRSGIAAVLKLWIKNNCKESPEEIYQLILSKHN